MSKTGLIIVAALLAAIAFALGHGVASRSRVEPRSQAEAARPVSRDLLVDALEVRDPLKRAGLLATLLSTLGPEAVPEVRGILKRPVIHTEFGVVELVLLVRFWAAHEPERATRWASMEAPMAYRVAAAVAAVETWARQDPQAALILVAEASAVGAAETPAVQRALVRGWVDSGQPGLAEYIAALGPSSPQQRAMSEFARRTLQRDGAKAVMSWAEAIPVKVPERDGPMKLAMYRQVGSELALADPAAAVLWCKRICEGAYGDRVRQLIAQRWASHDGRAALEWVASQEPGRVRDQAVKFVFRGWWRGDPEDFETWIAEMSRDGIEPWLQPLLENYAGAVARRSPEEAMQWAALIDDEATRERTMVNAARLWLVRDEAGANAWLEQSPLSEDARARAHAAAEEQLAGIAKRRQRQALRPPKPEPEMELFEP